MFLGFGKGLRISIEETGLEGNRHSYNTTFDPKRVLKGITIGKSNENDIMLYLGNIVDNYVSRQHGIITCKEENGKMRLFYEDKSVNGTMLLKDDREIKMKNTTEEIAKKSVLIIPLAHKERNAGWKIKIKNWNY